LACVMPVYGLCNMPFLYLWFISSDLLIHHPDQRPLLGSGENWGQSVKLTDGILLLGLKSKIRYKIRSPPPPILLSYGLAHMYCPIVEPETVADVTRAWIATSFRLNFWIL
jgi:hypothetical protein